MKLRSIVAVRLLFLCFLLITLQIFDLTAVNNQKNLQQDYILVKGIVKDEFGEPLAGVSVFVAETKIGVSTGYEGNYELKVKKGQTLSFNFIGFEQVDIIVKTDRYDVVMKESAAMLEQVVVTGYSKVELRKSTGAVAVMGTEELKSSPLKNVDQLMQGKLAGVVVSQTSGRPGASSKVRIRGTNTITGNSEPLWVVDGVPLQKNLPSVNSSQIKSGDFDGIFASGIGNINPNDIESITVLKDASAAAIYGSQAANGVIVVTTKRGKAGKTNISYMGAMSIQTKPSRSLHLMNSGQKIEWEKELWEEFSKKGYELTQGGVNTHYPVVGIVGQIKSSYGRFAGFSPQEKEDYISSLSEKSTDWFDVLFRNSISTSHHLSISGGSDKMNYYISGGANINNGLVIKTATNSYNISTKIDSHIGSRIKYGVKTDFSHQQSNAPSNNVNMFKYAYFANPYERLYDDDGNYKADETYFSLSAANGVISMPPPRNGFNIMREIKETSSLAKSSAANVKADMNIDILPGFTFNGLAAFSYNSDLSENINGKNTYAAWVDRPFEESLSSPRVYGSITQFSSVNAAYSLRGQFNYSNTFKNIHNISLIAGSEIRSSYSRSLMSKRYGFDPVTGNHSTPLYPNTGLGKINYDKLVSFGSIMDGINGQSKREDAFASFYGTATYNLNSKYVFSATIRSDGSNNFGSNQQFNANWSLSSAWNIDNEPWMKSLSNVISTLSLRGGFGYTGSVNKGVYPVLIMNYSNYFRKTGAEAYRMGYISNAPNPNLRWEKNRTLNLGLTFGFLKNRLNGELAYYHNKNMDQVTGVKVPSTTGFTEQRFNTSEQINTGVEFMLGAKVVSVKDFDWHITANIAYNYNQLTKYVSPDGNVLGDFYVGYPLGKIFTGKSLGIDPTTGIYKYELRPDARIQKLEDYAKYENYLFYVGTSNAPYNGGFSTNFSYKGLSLSMVGNFSIGGKVLNDIISPAKYSDAGEGGATEKIPSANSRNDLYVNHLNVVKEVVNRWTETNPRTDAYPRLLDAYAPQIKDANGNIVSSKMPISTTIANCTLLESISYLKFSSFTISYSLPQKWVKTLGLNDMNFGFLINNLWIISNYSGLDPESPGAVYPQSRSFSFNMSLSF